MQINAKRHSTRESAILAGVISLFFGATLSAQTMYSGFESSSTQPFDYEVVSGNTSEVITPSGFSARTGSKVYHVQWKQANYNGTRPTKSVEGKSDDGLLNYRIAQEGWFGFSFYLPTGFNMAKDQIIAQMHCYTFELGSTDKTLVIAISGGKLTCETFYGAGAAVLTSNPVLTLYDSPATGQWHDVIIHAKYGRASNGSVTVWYNGAAQGSPTVSATNINFGNDSWVNDTTLAHGSYQKFGLYAWDAAHYTTGEIRDAYYDEVSYVIGNPSNAYDLVRPGKHGSPTTLVSQNFNGMTTGAPPSGWTTVQGSGTSALVQVLATPSDKGIYIADSSSSECSTSAVPFTAQSGPGGICIAWSFKEPTTHDGAQFYPMTNGGTTQAIELLTTSTLRQGGSIPFSLVVRDGSGNDTQLYAVNTNQWYNVSVVAFPGTGLADLLVNGTMVFHNLPFRNLVGNIDGMLFGSGDTATGNVFIDDVTITKY